MLNLKDDNGKLLPQEVQDRVNSLEDWASVRASAWVSACASALDSTRTSARTSVWASALDSTRTSARASAMASAETWRSIFCFQLNGKNPPKRSNK